MHVTRQRRRLRRAPSRALRAARPPAPHRRGRHRGARRRRRGNGLRLHQGVRRQPGRHAVPQRDPGLRRPDHQADRRPPAHPVRQVHGLDGQPGRPIPRGDQRRQVGGPADLRPVDLQAHLDGRHRVRRQPEALRRHRRPGRPDVLAGRQVPLAAGAERPDPVPGQRRRHPRCADPSVPTARTVERPAPPWRARPIYSPDGVDPVRRGQRPEHRRGARPRHRRGRADLERRHRAPRARLRRRQALRQQRGRPPGPGR